MIQLINDLPFDSSNETTLDSLKKDWARFQDGLVALNEIPDAIRGVFQCEAEIIIQEEEDEELADGVVNEVTKEEEDADYLSHTLNPLSSVPSGNGKLILTSSKLYWVKSDPESSESLIGWSVDYRNVLLHAISKPESLRPYIYLQLSCNKILDNSGNEIDFDNDNDNEDEDEKFVEINLFVKDNDVADEIFVALSECASLHPCDSSDCESEDVEEEEDDVEQEEEEFDNKKCKIDQERFEDAAEN